MKKFWKKIVACCLCLVLGLSVVACAKPTTQMTEDNGEFVRLTWYIPVSSGLLPKDIQEVYTEMNKIFREKLNCEVTFKTVNTNQYNATILREINVGAQFDMCFTSNWTNNYQEAVRKRAYLEISNEWMNQYAPTIKGTFTEQEWDSVRIDGKLYGVVNEQIRARSAGALIDKEKFQNYLTAKGISAENVVIDSLDDLDPIFAYLKEQNPANSKDIAPALDMKILLYIMGYDVLYNPKMPGVVAFDDENLKVVNQFETEEFKQIITKTAEWMDKGYYPQDLISNPINATTANVILTTYKPGLIKNVSNGAEIVPFQLSKAIMSTDGMLSQMTAISRTSVNPIRALKVLELMYKDKDLFNLLLNGIEGKHYEMDGENRVTPSTENPYFLDLGWTVGNQFNQYLLPGQSDTLWEDTAEMNRTATRSEAMGFIFNSKPVATQIAACTLVIDRKLNQVMYSMNIPNKTREENYQEFLQELDNAGADEIIAEMQKQIDEFKASKGE